MAIASMIPLIRVPLHFGKPKRRRPPHSKALRARGRGGLGRWRGDELGNHLGRNDLWLWGAVHTALQGPDACGMQGQHHAGDHGLVTKLSGRREFFRRRHRYQKAGCRSQQACHRGLVRKVEEIVRPKRRCCVRYLRKIHHEQPRTRIRLPATVETNAMLCSPR